MSLPFRRGPLGWLLRLVGLLPWWAEVGIVLVLLGAAAVGALRLAGDRVPPRVRSFEAGVAAYDTGRFEAAARWMRAVLAEDPRHAYARYLLGRSLCATGSEAEGLAELRSSFEIDPGNPEAAAFLAGHAVSEGRDGDAIAILRRCEQKRALTANGRLILAKIALRRGRLGSGIQDLRAAISAARSERPVAAILLLADLLDRRAAVTGAESDRSEAHRLFSRVLEWASEPGAGSRAEDLAAACLGLRQFDAALGHADRAVRAAGPAEARRTGLLKARVLAARGEFELADVEVDRVLAPGAEKEDFLAAAELHAGSGREAARLRVLDAARGRFPSDEEILVAWAEAHAGAGRGGEILEALRAEGAGSAACLLLAARIEHGLGRMAASRETLRAAGIAFPGDRRVRAAALSARIEEIEGDPARASAESLAELEGELRRFVEEPGEFPEPYAGVLTGRLLLVAGRHAEGVERLLAARTESPLDAQVAAEVTRALMRAGRDEEVVAILDHRNAPEADLLLAESLVRLGRYSRAATILREVLAGSPGNHVARRLLARLCVAGERFDAAHDEYARLAKDLPEDFQIAAMEGYLALVTRKVDDPGKAFERAKGLARATRDVVEVAWLLARWLSQRNRPEEAEAVFRDLLAERPGDPLAILAQARFLASVGKAGEARAVLERALPGNPDDPGMRRMLGEVILSAGGTAEDVGPWIEEIERADPGHPDAAYLRGRVAFAAGDMAGAKAELRRSLARRPLDTAALLALGLALLRDGRPEEASRPLMLARSVEPESDAVRFALARALAASASDLFARGEVRDAKVRLEKSLEAVPRSPDVTRLFASSLAVLGDRAQAEKECQALLRAEPRDLGGRRLMAALLARRGDLEGAAEMCRVACEVSDRPEFDRLLLAWVEYRRGRAEAAIAAARSAIGDGTPTPPATEVLVLSLAAAGRVPEAEAFLDALIASKPAEAHPFAMLGYVKEGRGDAGGAAAAYEQALARDPEMYGALRNLVRLDLETRSDWRAALKRVTDRLAESPEDPTLNYLAGWVLSRVVRREEAATFLHRALKSDPTKRPAALLLATLKLELGDPSGARAVVAPLLERDPGDRDALLADAHGLELEGRAGEATAAYRAGLVTDPECVTALNNLALLLLGTRAGQMEARKFMERALGREPGNPDLHDSLGQVLAALGDYTGARDSFRKALAGFEEILLRCETAGRGGGGGGQPERARETGRLVARQIDQCRARLAGMEQALAPR